MNDTAIDHLLDKALQLPNESEQKAFLAKSCGKDDALRQKLENLLAEHRHAAAFFNDIEVGFESEVAPTMSAESGELESSEKAGSVIGRFTLLEKIGEGGMGVVYMAEQSEPVTRKVALKIIKLGMDTKQVIARFRAERQALALMEHPNIARVLDGGATETGRPYFVMELVPGIPITEFCERYKLTTKEKIELFLPVCKAIQSAHQKGIIHRDIKPSNVLVSFLHGEAIAKVIDFGIAKAINQKLTEKTLFTRYGAMVGTPAYMSPEQAEMSLIDIDTRTDVYSLGVLLYELLTGTTPFTADRLRSAGFAELQRIIAEEEPEKPSTRLSKTRASITDNASAIQSKAARPAATLDKDLDWVTMKCLEKDRRRRYESANDLAADLKRHINHEPVLAVAPTLAYQFEKFYRRHRGLVRSAIITFTVLIVTTAISVALALLNSKLRIKAESAHQLALNQSIELENNLYVSDMLTVEDAVKDDELDRARQILLQHKKEPSGRDLRGLVWRFYWQQAKGKQLHTFHAHDNKTDLAAVNRSQISQIQVLEGGQRLVTAGYDRRIKLWNTSSNQLIHEWEGGRFAISPNGKLIGYMNLQRELVVWDLESPHLVRAGYNADRQINHFAFTHDSENIVIFSSDRERGTEVTLRVSVTNILTGEEIFSPKGLWTDYAVSPSAPIIWTTGTNQRTTGPHNLNMIDEPIQGYLWNYEKQTMIHSPIATHGMGARFSPRGNYIAVSHSMEPFNMNANIDTSIYRVANSERIATLPGASLGANINNPSTVAFSQNEELIAAPIYPGSMTIDVWEITTGKRVARYTGHSNKITSLVFHPESDDILISISEDKTLQYWNHRKNRSLKRFTGPTSKMSSLAVNQTGELVITGGYDGWLSFWPPNVTSPAITFTNATATPSCPIFSAHGRYVVLAEQTSQSQHSLRYVMVGQGAPRPQTKRSVFETETTKQLWNVPKTEKALGFSADEKLLLTVSTNLIVTRAVTTGSIVRKVALETPIAAIDFSRSIPRLQDLSPDGSTMVTFNEDNTIRLISMTTGKTLSTFDQACSRDSVRFTSSGKKLCFNTEKGRRSGVWNPLEDKIVWLKTTEDAWSGQRLVPSPDEKLIAGICYDRAVRIWSIDTGELNKVIKGGENRDVFFTPDNRSFAIRQSQMLNNPRRQETSLKFFDRRTWSQIAELRPPLNSGWIARNPLSPNGRDLLLSSNKNISILKTPSLEEIDKSTSTVPDTTNMAPR